jgi:predicted short-subunit dehydrogenase-like oxidoreductase (DUF2520 family)
MKRPSLGIVGAGKLARAIAPLLDEAGYRFVAVASRRPADARRLARALRARACEAPAEVVERAACVLLAVPDRSLATVARSLAREAGSRLGGRVVLHHAGSLGLEPLAPLARRGAEIGLLHPFQTLADPRIARELVRGSAARIDGTRRARSVARRMALDLGLVPLDPRTTSRDLAAYHAAAALAANDLLGLLSLARGVLVGTGVDARRAERALVRLARGALAHAERAGLARALTGPVARGDAQALRSHLAALGSRNPEAALVHAALSREILRLAYPGARARSAAARSIRRALAARRGGRRRATV